MPDKFTQMTAELHRYAVEHSAHEDDLLRRLAEETERMAGRWSIMQVAADQAALITLMVRAIGASSALEIGTFTGYGAISIARGLPGHGRLVTFELNQDYAAVARRYFEEAGLADRIELRVGPALDALRGMDEDGSFDFAFIDANEDDYPSYYEECLRLLRPGGLVMVDNVFYDGRVLDSAEVGEDRRGSREAIRELNDRIAADERVMERAMVGVSDGITLALKR
jgi:predicted O-methyltransferase YrrM